MYRSDGRTKKSKMQILATGSMSDCKNKYRFRFGRFLGSFIGWENEKIVRNVTKKGLMSGRNFFFTLHHIA